MPEKDNKKYQLIYYIVTFQMLRLVILFGVLAVAFAAPFTAELDGEWEAYKATHNKQYHGDVEQLRYVNQCRSIQN